MLNITAMRVRASERKIQTGCIRFPAPLLKIFRGVIGHHHSDDSTTNRTNA